MRADEMADVLGTLATAGSIGLVVVAVAAVSSRPALAAIRRAVAGAGTGLAAFFATVATAGSLWFSEVAGFPPCVLCWYQRIAMYPLAVLLAVAALRRDRGLRFYGMVAALIGLSVSSYHVLVEIYPSWESGSCDPGNPCSLRWVEGLGYWTIPRMAWVAFALVATVLWLDRAPPVTQDQDSDLMTGARR